MICPHCLRDTEAIGTKDVSNEPWFVWFDAFWSCYPRKVAKASALKAWKKAATSEAVKDAIMAGLKAQLPEMRRRGIIGTKFDTTYIPHAATWLNGRRWEDENTANTANTAKRVIACDKCGDTGMIALRATPTECDLWRCSCPRGQLPGLMVGRFNLETGELISNETPQDGVI
jgi:hypothetical protein